MKLIIDIDEEWYSNIIASKDYIDEDTEAHLILDGKPCEERPQGEWIEFAEFVAKEVCTDNFKDNADSFAELACRRLVKLGLLKLDGDTYKKDGTE